MSATWGDATATWADPVVTWTGHRPTEPPPTTIVLNGRVVTLTVTPDTTGVTVTARVEPR